nr:MAG TPA: hypothetical protein [Caudoviricetes sp.]
MQNYKTMYYFRQLESQKDSQKAGATSPAFVIFRHIQLMHYLFL